MQLVLSTSNPSGRMKAPEQDSRFLDVYDPVPWRQTRRKECVPKERSVRRRRTCPETDDQFAASASAHLDLNRTGTRFPTGLNETDEHMPTAPIRAHTVPLAEYRHEAALVTRITPRQNTEAFLTARNKQRESTCLSLRERCACLSTGPTSGRSSFPELLPGSETVLPMGPDRRIDVLAVDQGGEKGSQGILSSRTTRIDGLPVRDCQSPRNASRISKCSTTTPSPRDERIEVNGSARRHSARHPGPCKSVRA